jgi:GT2 family glycosyltransferase
MGAIAGANFAIRRKTFMELGGFDEEFMSLEDIELGLRLLRAGHQVVYAPHLTVRHVYRDDLETRVRKTSRYGYYECLIYDKHAAYHAIQAAMPSFGRLHFKLIRRIRKTKLMTATIFLIGGTIPFFTIILGRLMKKGIRNDLLYGLLLKLAVFEGKLHGILSGAAYQERRCLS